MTTNVHAGESAQPNKNPQPNPQPNSQPNVKANMKTDAKTEMNSNMSNWNDEIIARGEMILKKMEEQKGASIFSKDYWYGAIMDWSMKNDTFKTNMFRFVDVLPSLNSGSDVAKHLKEYFSGNSDELPSVFNFGLGLGGLAPGLMAGAIRKNVTQMAKMFITGESAQDALPVLKKARKNKITFTVDILGEATLNEKEAMEYYDRYLELIEWLAKDAQKWDQVDLIDRDSRGAIPKVNVSVKMTALYSQINDKAWEETKQKVKERLRPILRTGMQNQVFINLDMEHYGVKDLTLEIFSELMLEEEFRTYGFFGCVIQAYLKDSFEDLVRLKTIAEQRGTPFTIRLVKGAYWDSESIDSHQRGWPIPVYMNKAETDANYERCTLFLLQSFPHLYAALASHNVRSLAAALVAAEKLGLKSSDFEIQMLFGMADPIKKALVEMNYRVREYAPIGDLLPGMAYLVRRLLENTSNESWLRGKFAEGRAARELLMDPTSRVSTSKTFSFAEPPFRNEPFLDFAIKANRELVANSVSAVRKTLPVVVTPMVAGKKMATTENLSRVNPSLLSETVATVQLATVAQADAAMKVAHEYFPIWRKRPVEERAQLLDDLANKMIAKKGNLIAVQVLEVGKPWAEADGDVAEAIDFLKYYASEMRKLAKPLVTGHLPGEASQYYYHPKGPTVVIAPWNFPLAILTGMVGAALVAGNTVVMKPAEQSSLVAQSLYQLMIEVGFPPECIGFLPGLGETVGDALVKHPYTHTIAFTGSRAVGLSILRSSADIQPGQRHVKKCIIEMGGKNAMIIDSDADLDEAVDGALYSAFGFSGQKCSALSRLIVIEDIYEKVRDRFVESAKNLLVGAADSGEPYTGPVVDKEAYERILKTIETAKTKHKLVFLGEVPKGGHFVPLTIFENVQPTDSLAQEEVFGPVVVLLKAKNLQHALDIANDNMYALTGGLYSRSPENIKKVRQEFMVGNLYINRGITGAMVERHPFGGFKMSGLGSKTGGIDYLKQFLEPMAVAENTMRRGFVPFEETGF